MSLDDKFEELSEQINQALTLQEARRSELLDRAITKGTTLLEVARKPIDQIGLAQLIASAWFFLERFEQSAEHYTAAINIALKHKVGTDSELSILYGNRAYSLAFLGKFEEAIADHTVALQLDPEGVDAAKNYNNRGFAYAALGDHTRAVMDFSRAIELDHWDAIIYHNRSDSYRHLGKIEEANSDHRIATRLDSGRAFAEMFRPSLMMPYCSRMTYPQIGACPIHQLEQFATQMIALRLGI